MIVGEVESQPTPLVFDDAPLQLRLTRDLSCGVDTGRIDGVRRRVLEIAPPHVLVEERGFACEYLEHPFVDAVFGEEAVYVDPPDLTEPMTPRDRLIPRSWVSTAAP
jgi:hypothetical protein